MIAGGDDVDADIEHLAGDTGGQAESGSGIFAVDDDQVDLMRIHQSMQLTGQGLATDSTDNIPNK
jgi:hypothetical protein